MLRFTYRQSIKVRVVAKCERHPRYNPERDGRDGIKGGCSTCWTLHDLVHARMKLDAAIHDFERRAAPWYPPAKPPRPPRPA